MKAQDELSACQKKLTTLEGEKNKMIIKLHEKEETIEKLNNKVSKQQEEI